MGTKAEPLNVLDLLVEPLCRSVGLVITPGVFNTLTVEVNAVGSLLHRRHIGCHILFEPRGKGGATITELGKCHNIVEFNKGLTGNFQIGDEGIDGFKLLITLIPVLVPIGRVIVGRCDEDLLGTLDEHILVFQLPGFTEHSLCHFGVTDRFVAAGLAIFFDSCAFEAFPVVDTDRVDRLGEELDHMEHINADLCMGEAVPGDLGEAAPHVAADVFHVLPDVWRVFHEIVVQEAVLGAVEDIDNPGVIDIGQDTVVCLRVIVSGVLVVGAGLAVEFINTERHGQILRLAGHDLVHDILYDGRAGLCVDADLCDVMGGGSKA